jgi:hypothetical protein
MYCTTNNMKYKPWKLPGHDCERSGFWNAPFVYERHWSQQDGATSHTATLSIIWRGTFFQVDSFLDYETLWLPRSPELSPLTSFFALCPPHPLYSTDTSSNVWGAADKDSGRDSCYQKREGGSVKTQLSRYRIYWVDCDDMFRPCLAIFRLFHTKSYRRHVLTHFIGQ